MTKITSFDLTPFYRNTVGIDRLFDRITSQIDSAGSNYPPYDIVVTGENTYEIRIAAAGFQQDEIDVEFYEGRLTVKGEHKNEVYNAEDYLHHGISNRDWVRQYTLADYVEVQEAKMKDGVLTIKLERLVPDSMKPKKIAISYDKAGTA